MKEMFREKKLNGLKSLSEIRWSMRADAVQALNDAYDEIRSALQKICDDPDHQKSEPDAEGLLRKMTGNIGIRNFDGAVEHVIETIQ